MFFSKPFTHACYAGILTVTLSLLLPSILCAQSNVELPNRVTPLQIRPLPITWLSFRAIASGSVVDLNWTTSSDGESAVFSVERSADGENWSLIGSIPTLAGKLSQVYAFQDSLPLGGNNYYRLERGDPGIPNDTPQASQVEEVHFSQPLTYMVRPNPVQGELHLSLLSPANHHLQLMLLSADGKAVRTEQWSLSSTQQDLQMDVQGVPSGIYFLDIVDERGSHPQKVFVL